MLKRRLLLGVLSLVVLLNSLSVLPKISQASKNNRLPAVVVSSSPPPPQKLVLSYSLYGNKAKYLNGMIITASQIPTLYPDWEVWIYHDDLIPDRITEALSNLTHVRLLNVTHALPWTRSINPMTWRFLVASDPTVRAYCIRDGDSRPSVRAKAAVDEWLLSSNKSFHIMRDHPMHDPSRFATILGGMWGGLYRAVPNMESLLRSYYNATASPAGKRFRYAEDQDFLFHNILPLAMNDSLQHDAYYCDSAGGIAFPKGRANSFDFVGNADNRKAATNSRTKRDDRLLEAAAKNRFEKCNTLRREAMAASGGRVPDTPYLGQTKRSSTELWHGR